MKRVKSYRINEKLNRQKGITLIALIITIIVILILAGVTIANVTGENGILSQSANAKEKNAKSSAEELVKTQVLGSYGDDKKISLSDLNNNLKSIEGLKYNGNMISDSNKIENLPAIVNVSGYDVIITEQGSVERAKKLEEAKSEDMIHNDKDIKVVVSNKIITVPAGFKIAKDSGATIEEGIVIEDGSKNQFVWVPVKRQNFETEFIRREGYENGKIQPNYTPNLGEADATGINNKVNETMKTQEEAKKMYASVKRNEGFYIARYEAGKNDDGDLVFKKGANVYTEIPWSANGKMQETTETTGGAVELSRNFANKNNYTTVTSTLIYGVQWDATIKWMENIDNPNTKGKKYIQDSTGMGWHGGNSGNSTHKTGEDLGEENNGANQVKKIYDLAGNVWEWTMESHYSNTRVFRGGVYHRTGFLYPASARYTYEPFNKFSTVGFRSTLFLDK